MPIHIPPPLEPWRLSSLKTVADSPWVGGGVCCTTCKNRSLFARSCKILQAPKGTPSGGPNLLCFFENFRKCSKNLGYERHNRLKTRFSMPKGAKGTFCLNLNKKKRSFKFKSWFFYCVNCECVRKNWEKKKSLFSFLDCFFLCVHFPTFLSQCLCTADWKLFCLHSSSKKEMSFFISTNCIGFSFCFLFNFFCRAHIKLIIICAVFLYIFNLLTNCSQTIVFVFCTSFFVVHKANW